MPSPRSPASTTRERLIETAERLFAVNGIAAVSLREIAAAAGQRNTSAVHYYFGDKQELVRAIFEYRMRDINALRMEMLKRIADGGPQDDLRVLLEALVFPLAANILEGSHYARFFSQLAADPVHRREFLHFGWEEADGLNAVWDGITARLSGLPEAVLRNRLRMLRTLVIMTAGDMEQRGATAEAGTPQPWAVDLVDAAEGMLTAPSRDAEAPPGRADRPVS
ncbi:AcrR family transcriptional regulator [Spinactinospora alkalitolerans]|uniref:AcrR family transcriptional regulator n=1 Tax=Spinactinospora alkalitolerans TaxID=687207 RepID=A0A852TYH9_9ACTN|nr:TetR/AcrR family transcriptional regulator [Spinactinospora alkalitolerans]NYE47054.1 AcrR family transcriptional regulator [Spinactinospora alkalitolerans]